MNFLKYIPFLDKKYLEWKENVEKEKEKEIKLEQDLTSLKQGIHLIALATTRTIENQEKIVKLLDKIVNHISKE